MRPFSTPLGLRSLLIVTAVALCTAPALAADRTPGMMQLQIGEQWVEGKPLFWSQRQVQVLARDGRLWDVSPAKVRTFRETGGDFKSYSSSDMRNQLRRELGTGFEVTGGGHYLVAHPAGERELWSKRFDDLYRSFVHYFRTRGFRLQEPEFPLVAVVWKKREDYFRYAQNDGAPIGADVLGYYSPMTNRITLYDSAQGNTNSDAWLQNAETIIHEATHQTAFNTGVHSRFALTPKWVAEGLGTMFEARGVWNSRTYTKQTDRLNLGRLNAFRRNLPQREKGTLAQLVSSDRLFDTNSGAAYAESWALTFYLVETLPREYARYLALTAARPGFEDYPSAQRLADFTSVFGGNLELVETKFLRYMAELK
jgi:hypothetical protein